MRKILPLIICTLILTACGKNSLRKAEKEFEETVSALSDAKQTPGGTYVVTEKEGTGDQAVASSFVVVYYTGSLMRDGKVFDQTPENQPARFHLSQVINGFKEGIMEMKEGGKATIYIPSEEGYGDKSVGLEIPKNANLIFEVELVKVE